VHLTAEQEVDGQQVTFFSSEFEENLRRILEDVFQEKEEARHFHAK